MSNLIAHALIKNSMDELLILKRTLTEQGKENYEGGKWDIPGGTVEKLEFPSSTAVRETKEETNLDVTVERILYEKSNMDTKKNQVFTTLIYLCSLSGTDETIELDLEEHDAYKWVTKEEILEMNDNDLVSYMKELMRVSLKT